MPCHAAGAVAGLVSLMVKHELVLSMVQSGGRR